MPSIVTKIVGAHFRGPDIVQRVQSLRKGTALDLQPEPTNPYDANAVRVLCEGQWLGYVPKVDSALVAKVIRDGLLETCTVMATPSILVVWRDPKAKEKPAEEKKEEPIDPLTEQQVNDRLDMIRREFQKRKVLEEV